MSAKNGATKTAKTRTQPEPKPEGGIKASTVIKLELSAGYANVLYENLKSAPYEVVGELMRQIEDRFRALKKGD